MIEFLSEYVVNEEARGQFELAFGPGGAWSKVLARCQGFRGTTLLRDVDDPRRYVTVELWDAIALRDNALVENKTAFDELMTAFSTWTDSRTELGTFRVQAEATVRPVDRNRRKGHLPSGRS
jgi:hypothetical protein